MIAVRRSRSGTNSRRRFHALVGSGLLLAVLRASGLSASERTRSLPGWLTAIDRSAAEALGTAYLAGHANEGDAGILLGLIEQVLVAGRRASGVAQPAVDVLAAVVREEFRVAEVVFVNGWMLSRSEARIYALAVLALPAGR
ncbi:MAG: hypothetical protein KDH15_08315 [Rhodocyclaceae bacterium]|nr:hypothetical protein [Rhodocyclaceae bacterium]